MEHREERSETTRQGRHLPWIVSAFGSPLRLAVAAILLVGLGLVIYRAFFYQSDVHKGMSALREAYSGQRPLEARISGLSYAPLVETRGNQNSGDQVFRNRAERILLDAMFTDPGPESQHALGKFYMTERKFDQAIIRFEEAMKTDSNNAQLYSDYGAALYEMGKVNRMGNETGKSLDQFARSLEHLNKALQLDGSLSEALFNRALLYEDMRLLQQSEEDWKRYLERDADSPWTDESRRHLNELEERKRARSQDGGELLAEFVAAYQSGDDEKAYDLLSKNTEAITGHLVWWQLLGAYLDTSLKGERDKAGEFLKALSYAGELQRQKSGDRFVSELSGFYESSGFKHRTSLVQAHTLIDQAHALLARSETDRAIELYEQARAIFDKTGDKVESWYARYWIGYSFYRKSEFEKSLSELSRVTEHAKLRSYFSLVERALTMIANIHEEFNQFSTSLAHYKESLEISININDHYNTQKNLTALAYALKNIGDRKESLMYMQDCLERSGDFWSGARQMYRNYDTAAGILNTFGYYAAAAEYEKAALGFASEAKDPGFEQLAYVQLGAIHAKLQDYSEALRCAEQSYEMAKAISSAGTSLRPLAFSSLQLAHIYRQTEEYDRATAYYDNAIGICKDIDLFAYLYEAHKGRLLCYIAQGNDASAEEELQTVLAFFEEHRSKIKEEKNRNSFFDLEQYVYDIAIDFEYSRKRDFEKAFDFSEVSRARSLYDLMTAGAEVLNDNSHDPVIASVPQPLMLSGIRARLPEQAQILQYSVLEDKLLVWLISRTKFEVKEQKITQGSLTDKVLNYWRSLSSRSEEAAKKSHVSGTELYELLIKPVESFLEKEKQICIVPDKALNYLPFNALISPDTDRYLISDYLVSFAPSANTFLLSTDGAVKRSGATEERVLSVGDPRFDRDAFPGLPDLPSSGKEAEAVSRCYKSRGCLVGENATKTRVRNEMAKADVIHLASHYVIDERNPMFSKLLLTDELKGGSKGQSSDGVLQALDIYRTRLPVTRLVTLSACQTGVEHYYNGEGMIGMSRTFLAAGVPLVVASLWPVASDPTADLMISFHKYRKQGGWSSAAALRQAQLDMIDDPQRRYNSPYYWAPFITVGGYANF